MNEPPQKPRGLDPRDLICFSDVAKTAENFEAVLRSLGIVVAPGSPLNDALVLLKSLEGFRLRERALPANLREQLPRAAGLLELVRLVIDGQENIQSLTPFVPHLKLLSNAKEVSQHVARARDEAANKLFELFFGSVCAACGSGLELADPDSSKKEKHPDILITIRGRRWAFECKVLTGNSPRTWFERLEDGVNQINNSPEAEIGCVAFSLKNLLDHDSFLPILNESEFQAGQEEPDFGAWVDDKTLIDYLGACGQFRDLEFRQMNVPSDLDELFAESKALPAVIFILPTVAFVASEAGPLLTPVHMMYLAPFGAMDAANEEVLNLLNESLHHRSLK